MEFEEMLKDLKMNWEFMQPYRSAIQIVKTKLESIDDELKCENGDSPIHNIQSRIKTPDSILEKMARKGYSIDKEGFYQLNDIAGLRVVCHYSNDIQYVSQLLIMHEDIQLIKKENYIDYPKESGYRSLHLVVRVQIYLKNGKVSIPVEIQLRTIAMDCWASLEHELYYKNHHCENEEVSSQLKECAIEIAKIDEKMQKIYHQLHNKI